MIDSTVTEKCLKALGGLVSSEEYMEEEGQICPKCREMHCLSSEQDQGESDTSLYLDGAVKHIRTIVCDCCGFKFSDVYKLVGYQELDD
jgi:C4-type Zn-finger protein